MDTEVWEAALYLRLSKGRAAIPRQRRETTQHIEAAGGVVTAEFTDKDTTAYQRPGEELPDRPGFAAMLGHLDHHPGVRVAAWHADRLIRSGGDAERLIGACVRSRHLVETRGSGSYDLATATGRRRLREDATHGAYEVDHAIERISARKREAASEGAWGGGPRPFGWDLVPSEPGDDRKYAGMRVRESEAGPLRDAARSVLSGVSLKALERQWAAQGITGTLGGYLDSQKIRRLLLRPRNAGICVHLGAETTTGQWPPVLDLAVFRALEARLGDPSRNVTTPGRKHLGTGLYQCGICHEPLISHRTGNGVRMSRRTVYMCRGHVARSAGPLDAWVGLLLTERLARDQAGGVRRMPQRHEDTSSLHAGVIAQQEELLELARMKMRGEIDAAQLAAGTAEGRKEIAALKARIAAAAGVDSLDGMPADFEAIRAWWKAQDVSRQRVIIGEHFEWVRVNPARKGKPPGAKRGEPYFDVSAIEYRWRGEE